jgi:vesicle-associated membrane protein 7
MSLLHALVAREDTILAECDKSSGQYSNGPFAFCHQRATPRLTLVFSPACQTILSKIPPNDSKLTYAADQILIHYQKKDGVTALVVAEDTAGRRVPFSFLAELHRKVSVTTRRECRDIQGSSADPPSTVAVHLVLQRE